MARMTLERWTDFSKWQGDVSDASLRAMKADGIVGVCVGSWHGIDANPYVESVLRRGRAIGLKTATYVIINNRPGAWTVQQGKAACGNEWQHLTFVSPDVEVPGVTEAILRDAIAEVKREGHRNLMYTGNWFWSIWQRELGHWPNVGNPDAWLADYDGVNALDSRMLPGYTTPQVAKQTHGSTQAYGTTVDFNVFDAAWIDGAAPSPPPEPEPEPELPEEEIMVIVAIRGKTKKTVYILNTDGRKYRLKDLPHWQALNRAAKPGALRLELLVIPDADVDAIPDEHA